MSTSLLRRPSSSRPAWSFIAIVVILASCGGEPPTRSGQAADPISLSSVDPTGAGGVGGDVLHQLVDQTAGAAVRVEPPALEAAGEDAEGEALEMLRAGRADVAVLRADTLATAGASSLVPLQLPLLVQSVEHAERVADAPLADDLMAGLGDIGLFGLALVPGGLRHPFGYGTPLLAVDDYRGAIINTRAGDGVGAIIAALGATTDHSVDAERSARARSGALRGIEVSVQQPMAVDRPAVVTSNVVLYTKFDVVVVTTDVWESLSESQRGELATAAREAGRAAVAARDTEVDGLNRWCASDGGASVRADEATIAEIEIALRPLVDDAVAASAEIARLVDGIEQLGGGMTRPPGKTCGTPPDDESATMATTTTPSTAPVRFDVEPVGPQDVFEGRWRIEVDEQILLDAGVSPQETGANVGVWTVEVTGNIADVQQPHGPNCTWEFSFAGDQVSVNYEANGNTACYGLSAGTYEIVDGVVFIDFDRARDNDVALDDALWAQGMHPIG